MKKHYMINIVLGIGIVTLFFLWIQSEKQNRTYEEYLSNSVESHISTIAESSLFTLKILREVLNRELITEEQAGELQSHFGSMAIEIQDLSKLGHSVGKLTYYNHNNVSKVMEDFHWYFLKINTNGKQSLTSEQMELMEKMVSLLTQYENVIQDLIGIPVDDVLVAFYAFQKNKNIHHRYWVEFLEGYERVTDTDATYVIY